MAGRHRFCLSAGNCVGYKKRADQEIFGYCSPSDSFYDSVQYWMGKRFGWTVEKEWMYVTPTVVAAINIAIRSFTEPGDGVIIQRPVYDPFATLVKRTGRKLVNNGLICVSGRYEMDFALLEKQASEKENKLLILCSPHNPVGRVWKKEELKRLSDICNRNGILVVADEIHTDLIYSGHTHIPYPLVAVENPDNTIYCMAPGKTFNVAGLKTSVVFIKNEKLRSQFIQQCLNMLLDVKNTFGIEAVCAAYSPAGEKWMADLPTYLEANRDFLEMYVAKNLPSVRFVIPEGTYLCWLDFSAIPQIYIGGTANFLGGQYSQIAVLSGQRLAGVYIFINFAMALAISMYTLSFCDYFFALFPGK